MNRKGFTLVELLGVIVILSIITLIAIPNITSTLERSKRDGYLTDATKMISLAEYELRKGEISKPEEGKIVKITLDYLSTTDVEKDPDGVPYSLPYSYVLVTRKNGYLKYYANLVADHGKASNNVWWGIKLVEKSELSSDNKYNKIDKNITLPDDSFINTATGCTASGMQSY